MTDRLRIALAQLNPTVGALAANLELGRKALADAVAAGADILMFPELFLTGYFPEDLLFRPQFVADAIAAARDLASATRGTGVSMILPTIWRDDAGLRNAIILAEDGEIVARRFKRELPNTDVFYEKRYFVPADLQEPLTIKGVTIGVPICEDIWHEQVCAHLVDQGARILLCPNGSPYWKDKQSTRYRLVRARVFEDNVPMLYLNQVGGQDELVYDGASFAIEPGNRICFQGRSFEPDFIVSDWARTADGWRCVEGNVEPLTSVEEAPWRACVLGLRDYMKKNGFSSVVLGLSGGIDSAVVAAIACDAIGPQNVHCLMLPYRYTSMESLRDAEDCAKRLGVRYDVVSIGTPVEGVNAEFSALFAGLEPGVAEENIQSRMRGLMLMAVSNKLGSLLVTTGNKSEMAVGYATIYGDMNGGFNPIKDMLKMQVYGLAAWRNANLPGDCLGPVGKIIPQAIIAKAPSAELRPDQKDQDTLPPYPVLDAILSALFEEELPVSDVVARGFDRALVKRIEKMVYIAEYKRRQSAPGVKLTSKAFGVGRKYPITNGYRDESGGMTSVRYAPSPTGLLHLGNARPALLNWLFARARSGRYVLRIDDTDAGRSTEEFVDAIKADLDWLGIVPDAVVRQSERSALYDAARDRLIASGRLYPAYETENELDRKRMRARAAGRPPIYDRAGLSLTEDQVRRYEAEGRRPHWRFRLDGKPVHFADLIRGDQTVNTASMSDPVLVREDGSYLYTLPSVVDDIDLGISHVIRGEDHVSNTGTQIEIFEALGAEPPFFAHHNLLTGASGEGLSKRLGSLSLTELREAGYEPIAVAIVAVLTGTSLPVEPYQSLGDLAQALDFSMISHGPARFDPADLDAINARVLHGMSYEAARPRLAALGLDREDLWLAVRENLSRFRDIADWGRIVSGPLDPVIADDDREFLAVARDLLPAEPWDIGTWALWTNALKARTGRKGRSLFQPLRLALTGRPDGPELRSLMPLLGRRACLDRLS